MSNVKVFKEFIKRVTPEPAWVGLKQLRQLYSIRNFQARIEHHKYHGFPLSVTVADGVGEGWYGQDWDPLPELELLSKHRLREGARVFDLGAHQSVVALILGRIVGLSGQVISLEASKRDAEIGLKNVQLNSPCNVTVIHGAIAEKSGEVDFSLDGHVSNTKTKAGRIRVRAYTIDELSHLYGPPDVLFMDVEGYEGHALQGARQTLDRCPDCFVEVHVGKGLENFGGTVQEIMSFFPKADYDLFINPEDGKVFQPFVLDSPIVKSRFFLVALARN